MKKILSLFLLLFSFISFFSIAGAVCTYTGGLESCMEGTTVVQVDNAELEKGFKEVITGWTNNIALFLGLLSIGAVIYGGLMMTLSTGEDEKIKKAKDIVKWSLLGLLGVILATTIVTLIIKLVYGISSNI